LLSLELQGFAGSGDFRFFGELYHILGLFVWYKRGTCGTDVVHSGVDGDGFTSPRKHFGFPGTPLPGGRWIEESKRRGDFLAGRAGAIW